jgi:hypothetical protein
MKSEDDLEDKLHTLTAWLRYTDSLTQTIAGWLCSPVEYTSLHHESRPVPSEYAVALDIPVGSNAVFRRGYLEVPSVASPRVVA